MISISVGRAGPRYGCAIKRVGAQVAEAVIRHGGFDTRTAESDEPQAELSSPIQVSITVMSLEITIEWSWGSP